MKRNDTTRKKKTETRKGSKKGIKRQRKTATHLLRLRDETDNDDSQASTMLLLGWVAEVKWVDTSEHTHTLSHWLARQAKAKETHEDAGIVFLQYFYFGGEHLPNAEKRSYFNEKKEKRNQKHNGCEFL